MKNYYKAIKLNDINEDINNFSITKLVCEKQLKIHASYKDNKGDLYSVILVFPFYFSYRWIDEGDAVATSSLLPGYDNWFFEVENSDYLNWFKTESFVRSDHNKIRHFAIYSRNDYIDVLSYKEPEVKFQKIDTIYN